MPRVRLSFTGVMSRLLGLAALFGVGLLLAGVVPSVGGAKTAVTPTEVTETTSNEQVVTTTVQETTTAPTITVVTTATLPLTTAPTTTSTESTSSGTPTWVWILVAALGAAVIGLLVYALTRRGGSGAIPETERRLRLQGAVDSWTTQGWALLSESADTAVLQRGNEHMTVTVDPAGHINTRATTPPPPEEPPDRWPEAGSH